MNRIFTSLLIGSVTTILICSSLPNSESAQLWDLIILLEFEKHSIIQGENPILHATIVDHAYKPLANVNARISVAGDSYNVLTDKDGKFMIIFDGTNFKSQTYVVNVYAEYEEKIGMTRDSFNVKGHIPKTTQFENQLELMELAHSIGKIKDDQNDPIAMKLHNHYLAIQKELSQARQDEQKLEESERNIEELKYTFRRIPLPARKLQLALAHWLFHTGTKGDHPCFSNSTGSARIKTNYSGTRTWSYQNL